MTTLLVTHPACAGHVLPERHPEQVARLAAVLKPFEDEAFKGLARAEAPQATREHLLLAHPASHIDMIFGNLPDEKYFFINEETILSPGSGEAALRAAGAAVHAVDEVYAGRAHNVFCAVRPPGHHAEPEEAMGFCLFNNAGIAAKHAQEKHGAARVAVIDFDVHHGNGTQALFEPEPALFYASTHQHPLYPGTGFAHETGVANNIVNAPLAPHASGRVFRAAFEDTILPALDSFAPSLIIVSAGFDGHKRDPLAEMELEEADYTWVTERLLAMADRHCDGRLVSVLEGGYDLDALGLAAAAHVKALMAAA